MSKDDMLFLKVFGDIDDFFIEQSFVAWNPKNNTFFWKYHKKIACVILGILFATVCIFHTEVQATLKKATTLLGEILNIKEDISSYTEIKNIPITKNGLTLTLKEVVLDKNQLLILVSKKFEDEKENTNIELSYSVKINGKEAKICKSCITDDAPDKIAEQYVVGYYLTDDMKIRNPAQIEAIFTANRVSDNSKIGTYKFNFTASWEELEKNTIRMPINQSIILPEKSELKLSDFTWNNVESNIVGECDNLLLGYEYYLSGQDNNGKQVTYTLLSYENSQAIFVNEEDKQISSSATSVELQLYRQSLGTLLSSSEDDEFVEEDFLGEDTPTVEKIGDSFKINMKRK